MGILIHVILFHAKILLFHNPDCFFQGIISEQVGLDWTFRETLHEKRNQRLFIRQIFCNATSKVTCVLFV